MAKLPLLQMTQLPLTSSGSSTSATATTPSLTSATNNTLVPKPNNRYIFKIYDAVSGKYLENKDYRWTYSNQGGIEFNTRADARLMLAKYLNLNLQNTFNRDFYVVKIAIKEDIGQITSMDEVIEFMNIIKELLVRYSNDSRFKDHQSYRQSVFSSHIADIKLIFPNASVGKFPHMLFWKRFQNGKFYKAGELLREYNIPKEAYKIRKASAGATIAFADLKYASLLKLSADIPMFSYEFKKGAII